MFTTINHVKDVTGADVTTDLLYMAQTIIEAYIGRKEAAVDNPDDIATIGDAVAYQAKYMLNNPDRVFDQVAVGYLSSGASAVTFKQGDFTAPWIAPLAVIALKNLSWRRSRSVKVGSLYGNPPVFDEWVYC